MNSSNYGSSSGSLPPCDPPPPCICPPCDDQYTSKPIRYSDGAVWMRHQDIAAPGSAFFGHKRVYGNQPAGGKHLGPNGFGWWVFQMPYVRSVNHSIVAVTFDADQTYWFDPAGITYTSRYSFLNVTLAEDPDAHTFTFVKAYPTGVEVTVFNSLDAPTNPGMFVSHTDTSGVTTTVASQTGTQINELQRAVTFGGTTTTESLVYSYVTSGVNAGLLDSVTYRRSIGVGAWTPVSQASFAYYADGDLNGNVNDLKTAAQQLPDGSGGWTTVAVRYYRYYLPNNNKGFAHGLKFNLGPEANRLAFNAGIDLDTASDSVLLNYADHYFEYDPTHRQVTKEISSVCDSCPGGGTSSDLFEFTNNPRNPADGFNTWRVKTVQTLPDGSQVVVYTNYAGQPMLYINIDASGANRWAKFYRYGAHGQAIWQVSPSGVALPASLGAIEQFDDLLNYLPAQQKYRYLNDDAGRFEMTEYFPYTDLTQGMVEGKISSRKIQEGQLGTPALLATFTYASNTDADGNSVYPVANEVKYPEADDASVTITTSYSYQWYAGTNRLQERTATLPAVSSAQNGSGTAPTVVEQYDAFGNVTQRTDERGVINTYAYDVVLSRMTQQVLDAQSGVTKPGVNVTTAFAYDLWGRLTQTTGPAHTTVLSGTATSVQAVTWNVYVQSTRPVSGTWDVDQTWTGRGYVTSGPTYTLVDPVTIAKADKDGRLTDRITSHRTSGSGALSPTDTFAQSDWQSWSSTQYDSQHRTLSERTYFLIPASGTGAEGTNYGQTTYGYDALERRNRVVAPGGTITRTVWTCPQRVASVWVGTDDTGATDANPAVWATFIQGSSNSSGGTSVSVTLANVAAGDTLVAYAGARTTAAPSGSAVTDSHGNTWTLVRAQAGATATAGGAGLWVARSVAGGTTTITFNAGASGCAVAVAEYLNVSSLAVSDGSSSASTATASSTPAAGSFSTSHAIDLLFAGASQAQADVTWSAGSGYTLRGSIGSSANMALAVEDQLVFSTGTYDPALSMSTSTVWTAIGAALVSANNMVQVTANQYDGGSAGGDGNLTQVTQYASDTDTRITQHGYDFRDRRTSLTDALNGYTVYTYDNLDRLTQTQRYASSGGNLIAQSATKYDDRNRVYQQIAYAVDPGTGTVGNALTGNSWYDPSGNLLQQINPGDGQVFTKSAYNGVGWVTATYRGYNPTGTSYSQAGTVANDIIVEQAQNTFDEAGNLVSQASFQRLNDAPFSGTGSTGALSYASDPKARVSYTAAWFDGIDRPVANANHGAIASFTRPDTPPASSSTILVSSTSYDEAGQANQTTDPMGYVTQTSYDAAGRVTQKVEDAGSGMLNRTTNWTYTLDGLVATLTAANASTGDQTTTYIYGTNLTTSTVARNDLLASVAYPDSVSGSDVVSYMYNRQNQQVTVTDQRGTIRTFLYDKLGRLTDDCVTTTGSGTDTAVRRISTTYEVRGMVASVTSFDNPTPGSGTALNQCAMTYNAFAQLAQEQQDHAGIVGGSSPGVQYAYDSGASGSNEIRLGGLTYPNGRAITYSYGTLGGINDLLNRVDTIQDTTSGTTDLASYTYLGLGTVVRIAYPEPGVWLDLWGGTSGVFSGLDPFGRITDQRWQNNTASMPADIDRYQYGYDQNSNRVWKANVVGTPLVSGGLDEYYAYDHHNRLIQMQRGILNSIRTGISGTAVLQQNWTLDQIGNWSVFVTQASGTTNLNQSRTSNAVNEITNISESTGPTWIVPSYDAAGNTTTMPQVADPTQSYTATYDAWNRMTEISASGSLAAQYAYDGRNRLATKVTYAGASPGEMRDFYYTDDWQDIEERLSNSTRMTNQYVWGMRYVDELVCRDDATPERLYALQDANFNVTGIVEITGNVAERYVYEAYGKDTAMTGAWIAMSDARAWNTRFTGRVCAAGDGLYYYRARYYDPGMGRFSGRDPLEYINGLDLYEYVCSNPTIRTDPSGRNVYQGQHCCNLFKTTWWLFIPIGRECVSSVCVLVASHSSNWSTFSQSTFADAAASTCCNSESGTTAVAFQACIEADMANTKKTDPSFSWVVVPLP